jgi:hypothetical protein
VPSVRSGCGCGCLAVVLGGVLVLGGVWYGRGMFERPAASYEIGNPVDGRRAQQKLFELARRAAPRRGDQRRVAVTLFEREINAFLTRHVSEDLPFVEGAVHLVGNGVIEVGGRLPLRAVLGDSVGSAAGILPRRWAGQPVWIRLRGPLRLEAGTARDGPRRLRLEVESVWVGTRRVPAVMLTVLPEGPILRATRWSVSGTIDSVVVEPGRLTVTSRP